MCLFMCAHALLWLQDPPGCGIVPPVAMVIRTFLLHNPSVNIQRHNMLVVIYAFLPLQTVVLYVFKGVSMAVRRLVQKLASPLSCFIIPHRDYFNLFSAKKKKSKKKVFLNYYFPAEGGKKKGTKKYIFGGKMGPW